MQRVLNNKCSKFESDKTHKRNCNTHAYLVQQRMIQKGRVASRVWWSRTNIGMNTEKSRNASKWIVIAAAAWHFARRKLFLLASHKVTLGSLADAWRIVTRDLALCHHVMYLMTVPKHVRTEHGSYNWIVAPTTSVRWCRASWSRAEWFISERCRAEACGGCHSR